MPGTAFIVIRRDCSQGRNLGSWRFWILLSSVLEIELKPIFCFFKNINYEFLSLKKELKQITIIKITPNNSISNNKIKMHSSKDISLGYRIYCKSNFFNIDWLQNTQPIIWNEQNKNKKLPCYDFGVSFLRRVNPRNVLRDQW